MQEIPEGSETSTLSRFAFQLLKRLSDTEEARAEFDRRAEACTPPLDEGELSTIWAQLWPPTGARSRVARTI